MRIAVYNSCAIRLKKWEYKTLSYCSATVNDLQTKVESLTTTNALMKEDLSITRSCVDKIQVISTYRYLINICIDKGNG